MLLWSHAMPPSLDPQDPLALLSALLACPSVTPEEAGTLDLLEGVLGGLGFSVTRMTEREDGTPDVENLYARLGSGGAVLGFAGHVDVVPPGKSEDWQSPPFSPEIRNGKIYGRGAVDMKGGIAAFTAALAREQAKGLPPMLDLALIITGDEEGPSINGTSKILRWMEAKGEQVDFCLVGEPTSLRSVGDTLKVGRRGSLSFTLEILGKQGHSAYPERAINPVPVLAQVITALSGEQDQGTEHFQPSHLEFIQLDGANEAWNVIPPSVSARANVRFNVLWNAESLASHLSARAAETAKSHGCEARLTFLPCLSPAFLTEKSEEMVRVMQAVEAVTGEEPKLSTGGGTSDARYIKDHCAVIEIGDVGTSMHQVNEHTSLENLERLTEIYQAVIRAFGGWRGSRGIAP